MQTNTQEKSVPRPVRYGRPSVPPNLFTDKKTKPMSLRKRLAMTGLFSVLSFVILFYPQGVTVKVDGKTVPAVIYSVDAPVAGRVAKVLQTEGSSVEKGAVVATLQSDELQNQITQQVKEVEILKSQLQKAALELQNQETRVKIRRLYLEVGTISQSELTQTENDLAKAQAEVTLLTRQLEKGQASLEHLQALEGMLAIKAPAAGVILTGLKSKLGMYLSQGNEVFQLASHDTALEFLVPEDQAQHIAPGTTLKVRFLSDSFKTYAASVTKLDEKVDEQIERMWLVKNVVRVTARLDEPLKLSPGMKVQAAFHSQSKTNLARKIAAHLFL